MLKVKKSFSGKGLYATRSFKKGEYVIEYFGDILDLKQFGESTSTFLFTLTEKITIDGKRKENIARYINHSCNPNVEVKGKKRLWIYAKRKIKIGEELTLDYGNEYVEFYIKKCLCGQCKKKKKINGSKQKAAKMD